MVWLNWHQKAGQQLLNLASLREPFHILTITLLSLLLPLSFLLLSRLTCAHCYLLSLEYSNPSSQISSFLLSFVLYTNPSVLYLLVSIVSIATLIHGLTGKVIFLSESPGPVLRPHLYIAWIFVCTLQVFVGLGIEGTIAGGIDGSIISMERSLFGKAVFFLGLHETMLHWSRAAVRPVVDDTIFGVAREERWAERVAMAASFGTLWWWKLRNEVGAMVVVGEFKRELLMSRGVADFVAWWLYYLTVTIGMIRVVKGFMWIGMLLIRRRETGNSADSNEDEDKV
ncbi:hypothetical protein I3843_07G116600 [Carya illinoinensis]|uniref:Transmembrane protein n=1 Tax=Carya illinoinensis TaxID=32201 RepID=A0A8T1PTY0_CARIL|nr:uncharacterized protein LOC122317524 [Carya illinoinensis]KAG6648009.1 hypothetical protein CIPAW_07G118200 [Carya illinoinensis]KAG6704147.1 hypothetical protein I3842_07G121400 [Carya illinoinensis]KAG7971061.1 hypothetical protein I3843_07G116600 [Carya illinoinensis]